MSNIDLETGMHLPLSILLNEAWKRRRLAFDNKIFFAAPGVKNYENEFYSNNRHRFVSISITGNKCALNCGHCGGKLLNSMLSCPTPESLMKTAKKLQLSDCEGVLLSGGADETGAVPLSPFLDAIKEIKSWGLKVIAHTGLAGEKVLAGLKEAGVNQVLVDIIGSSETIREVYHLPYGPAAYQEFLKLCQQYELEVAPHIVVGLHYGQIKGEIKALQMVSNVHPRRLVIVILTPISGTLMAKVVPPSVEECARFLALARIANPYAYLSLGCARPAGYQRPLLEQYALNAGVNTITYPSPETIALAQEMGLAAEFNDYCCTLMGE